MPDFDAPLGVAPTTPTHPGPNPRDSRDGFSTERMWLICVILSLGGTRYPEASLALAQLPGQAPGAAPSVVQPQCAACNRPGKFASDRGSICQITCALRMNGHSGKTSGRRWLAGRGEEGVAVTATAGRGLGASGWLEARALSMGHRGDRRRRKTASPTDPCFSARPREISRGVCRTDSSEAVACSGQELEL